MMREKLTLILHQDTLERVIVIARLARDILDRITKGMIILENMKRG